jgi:hypothetical protein
MSNTESLRNLPEILDEVHLQTAIKKMGRRGLEAVSWQEIVAVGEIDIESDMVSYGAQQERIGELFGRQHFLRMSITNEFSLNASPDKRKVDRQIITWDGRDVADNFNNARILVTKDEIAAIEDDTWHYIVETEFGGRNVKGRSVIRATRERFGHEAIQVVSGEMAEQINKLIVVAPDYQ